MSEWRSFPKVELHRHLEGSLRLSTVQELAAAPVKQGHQFKPPLPTPITTEGVIKCFCVTSPVSDLIECLERFWNLQSLLATEDIIERVAYEAVEDAYQDSIRLLELRYSPGFICINHEGLTPAKVHDAVMRGLNRAREKFSDMAVGLIGIVDRNQPVAQAEEAMDFLIDRKSDFIGVDLANDELGFDCKLFQDIFKKAADAGLRATIHSGEVDVPESPFFVKDAVEVLGAERIGHGLMVSRDESVMSMLREKGVILEVSVTSNFMTNVITSQASHPFPDIRKNGVKICINSDDPGLFNLSLSDEYELLAKHYRLTQDDFNQFNDDAARASFISDDEKERVWWSHRK